ncbi:ankyrin repeat domain-containing protein [Variovorax sp. J31P207]|uniref:ankyrin repeat domain-containing protein n=1 Tax=Variovorax sp. J31P207 TaxID=3053510 RepID=UPI002578DAB1|nr:ankyrin repeat domain-containing protein [Variovorax sp. J31P207]MDM0070566.1 hypothetical protein [Variovorax sp. J31P207]
MEKFGKIGCDVNAKDGSGFTALDFSALTGDKGIANLLLDSGADVDAIDNQGNTTLWRAAMGA